MLEWRGPSPYHFLALPPAVCDDVRERAAEVSYGWGVVPVHLELTGGPERTGLRATSSLIPRDGGYLLPLKDAVRRPAGLEPGHEVTVRLALRARR